MKKTLLVTLICSGLLAACSSSSKDHSITPSLDSQDAKSSVNSNSDKNIPDSYIVVSDKQDITNTERKIRETLNPNLEKMESFFSTGEDLGLNKLYLDGTVVELIPKGIGSGEFVALNPNNYKTGKVISDRKFKNVRFGYVQNQMFAHGNASINVPATGEATYLGDVVAVALPIKTDGSIDVSHNAGIVTGESKIKVDFANKAVDMAFSNFKTDNVSGYTIGDIQVKGSFEKANIKPEKMSYVEINSNDDFKQGRVQAHFYGNNAEAVAGTFHKQTDDNHYIEASFGAKKQ